MQRVIQDAKSIEAEVAMVPRDIAGNDFSSKHVWLRQNRHQIQQPMFLIAFSHSSKRYQQRARGPGRGAAAWRLGREAEAGY